LEKNVKMALSAAVVVVLVVIGATSSYWLPQPAKPPVTPQLTPEQRYFLDNLVKISEERPVRLHPHSRGHANRIITKEIYDTLVTFEGSETLQVSPCLASSWEVSPDYKVFTFKLRKGVRFYPSGDPFNASCVKFSLDMIHKEDKGPLYLCVPYPYDRTEIVDEYTARIVLKFSVPYYLQMLAYPTYGAMVNPKFVQAHGGVVAGKYNEYLLTHVDGTGMWTLEDWKEGDRVVLKRNPNWWGGWDGKDNYPKRILIREVPEASTRLMLLARGDADIANIPLDFLPELNKRINSENLPITIVEKDEKGNLLPSLDQVSLILQHRYPAATRDVHIRKMICHAWPYEKYIKDVLRGYGVRSGMFPPGTLVSRQDYPRYDYDLTKAKNEFQLAAPEVKEQVIKNGIRFTYSEGRAAGKQAALMLQAELAKIDVKLVIEEVPYATEVDYSTSVTPRFEIMSGSSSADMNEPANFAQYWTTETWPPRGWRGDFRGSPESDILWQKAGMETNIEERKKIYWQIEKIFYDNASSVFLYTIPGAGIDHNVQGTWVKGFKFTVLSSVTKTFSTVYKELPSFKGGPPPKSFKLTLSVATRIEDLTGDLLSSRRH